MSRYIVQMLDRLVREDECFIHFAPTQSSGPLSIVQFGYQHTPSGYGYGPSIRDHYLLHFIRKGTGIFRTHNMEYEIQSHSIFAIYPQQISYYESSSKNPWEYYWLGFNGSWAEEVMSRIGFSADINIAVQMLDPDQVFEELEEIRNLMFLEQHPDRRILEIMGKIYHLLYGISVNRQSTSKIRREAINNLGHEYTQTILSIIETSYDEQISISAMAEKLNLNRSYMTSLFKQDTGMSIRQYLSQFRIEKAKMLLQNMRYSVKEVAFECGFSDPLYMSRAFKAHTGMSPQEWRRHMAVSDAKSDKSNTD